MSATRSIPLVNPDRIFNNVPPLPPPWPKAASVLTSLKEQESTKLKWKACPEDDKTLTRVLRNLQTTLRSVHKHKIPWPSSDPQVSSAPPDEYLWQLLSPITAIYNNLHPSDALKTPMECKKVNLGPSVSAVTFAAKDFEVWSMTPPLIVSIPDALFETGTKLSLPTQKILSSALNYNKAIPTVILTNYREFAVFRPPSHICSEPRYERISTERSSLSLQVLVAAYLHDSLPATAFIKVPHPDMEVDEDLILPEGPPQNPNAPLLPDETVFRTYHRHTDFDMATLVRDKKRALQFFRWREYVQKAYSKLVGHPNAIVTAKTHEVGFSVGLQRPIFPFDHSDVAPETTSHIKAIKRESPLVSSQLHESFKNSKSFTLKIISVITEGSDRGICTVYRCQITSIDGKKATSSDLCLKLFDDRFQPLPSPDPEDENLDDELPRWFDAVVPAEMYAINEAFAYDKLEPAQGSLVPWFFGTHQFTLPNGTVLYGLLMELVEAYDLASDYAKNLTAPRQIKVIQSARHAARVLDIADVSQRDWHGGQIVISKHPETKEDHAVFIDFASTTQTWDTDDRNYIANYFGTLIVLLGKVDEVALDPALVWKYFGNPDDWDPITAFVTVGPNGKEMRQVKAKDMFPYIHSV